MKRLSAALSCLILGVGLAGAEPKGGPGKGRLAPDLQLFLRGANGNRMVSVVLNLDPGHAGRVAREIPTIGGEVQAVFRTLDQMMAEVPAGVLDRLTRIEGVDYVAPDRPVRGVESHLQVTTGASQVQVLAAPGASGQRWRGSEAAGVRPLPELAGRGIVIGVVDSGVDLDHLDLRDGGRRRVLLRIDFTDVTWVEGTFSDDLVAVGQGDTWQGILDGAAAAWKTELMPDAFFTLDASGLIWGYRRWYIGDASLIWGCVASGGDGLSQRRARPKRVVASRPAGPACGEPAPCPPRGAGSTLFDRADTCAS